GWRTTAKACPGNCASTASTTRVAGSPVASETTWSSTTGLLSVASVVTSIVSPHGRARGISRRSDDREGRRAQPPAPIRLPILRHLRRPRLLVRLRALRRAPEAERQGRVAAVDGAGARGHRPPRLRDHPQPAGLGRLRAPRRLLGPARRLPHVQAPL